MYDVSEHRKVNYKKNRFMSACGSRDLSGRLATIAALILIGD